VKKSLGRATLVIAAALALAGIATAATTLSVAITSPASGSSVSLSKYPHLAVAGTASFAPTTVSSTTFYLRRAGCGTANDNPHLSRTKATNDGGDGCGLIINGVTGLGGDVDQSAFIDFPASDGMPVAYDAKPITGVISLTGAQVGIAEVDVDVSALVRGQAVDLGKTSASATLDPTASSTPVPFTIPANTALNGGDIQALDLRVLVHGPNVYSGFLTVNGGASYVKLPSYTASIHKSVSFSIDGKPSLLAHLSGSTWTLTVPTPAVGKHTITAKATQGYSTSAAAQSTFNVTK
jgi:hypothetical protein